LLEKNVCRSGARGRLPRDLVKKWEIEGCRWSPKNGTQSDVIFQRTTTGPGSFTCIEIGRPNCSYESDPVGSVKSDPCPTLLTGAQARDGVFAPTCPLVNGNVLHDRCQNCCIKSKLINILRKAGQLRQFAIAASPPR